MINTEWAGLLDSKLIQVSTEIRKVWNSFMNTKKSYYDL